MNFAVRARGAEPGAGSNAVQQLVRQRDGRCRATRGSKRV